MEEELASETVSLGVLNSPRTLKMLPTRTSHVYSIHFVLGLVFYLLARYLGFIQDLFD